MTAFIIKYWVETIFGGVLILMGVLLKKVKKEVAGFKATQNGVQSLLRDKIIDKYDKYKETNKIPLYAKESIMHLYDDYKALGGNGVIEDIIEEIREMEVITHINRG